MLNIRESGHAPKRRGESAGESGRTSWLSLAARLTQAQRYGKGSSFESSVEAVTSRRRGLAANPEGIPHPNTSFEFPSFEGLELAT